MAKAKKEQQYYNGIAVDSQEEIMMLMWLEELIEANYVKKLERALTYTLSDRFENKYSQIVEMKTKSKTVEKNQVLLEEHVYTPEFLVVWTVKGAQAFLWEKNKRVNTKHNKLFVGKTSGTENICWLEVKPSFDQNNMTRLFKINQKWMWEKYEIYVNLVQPHKLFEETFTPKAWLTTATGKQRVIHWKVRSLEEYVNNLNNQ